MVNISPKLHKKGAASIYVVVFATILFSVITLSFIRIILSETSQSSNDDLSQSAYDSALAGVEDAKIALTKYYDCISKSDGADCEANLVFAQSCKEYGLSQYLYDFQGEVKIQEGAGAQAQNDTAADQAYTCVILNNVVPDYRSTLTSDTRVRIVPISIDNESNIAASQNIEQVKTIRFSWFSKTNSMKVNNLREDRTNLSLPNKDGAPTPPVISLTLIRAPGTFSYSDFSNANGNSTSTVILMPTSTPNRNAEGEVEQDKISQADLDKAADAYKSNSNLFPNSPFPVYCATGTEFACNVELTEMDFSQNKNVMLVVSLPYGDALTDFAVTLLDEDGKIVNFENAQISVDSTGRANQLVRRVETRLEPADNFFPYPQYALELTGDGEESFLKNFWITYNCWTESGECRNYGDA